MLPAGTSGVVTLTFPSNTLYRAGLFWGLALLPVLALLALLRPRREVDDEPAHPWRVPTAAAAVGVLAAGWLVSGVAGVVVFAGALAVRYRLRDRPSLSDSVTLGVTATGFILAGAVLSRHPWRSVSGYVGHAWGVQLLALIAVAALAASVVPITRSRAADE